MSDAGGVGTFWKVGGGGHNEKGHCFEQKGNPNWGTFTSKRAPSGHNRHFKDKNDIFRMKRRKI